eukprot:1142275-Pelagomonas_calceolata.AAC.8
MTSPPVLNFFPTPQEIANIKGISDQTAEKLQQAGNALIPFGDFLSTSLSHGSPDVAHHMH